MSSNLACVGLDFADSGELGRLLERAYATARALGTYDGVRVVRWEDPSGAALVLGVQAGDCVDLVPTYASTAGGKFANCQLINESVASAEVVDADDEQLTALTFDTEQYRQMKALGQPIAGNALITALGVSVQVHADAAAFEVSTDSLLAPSADATDRPLPDYAERGWSRPLRLASESFFSHGIWGDPSDSTAHAQLSGVVLKASHRRCALTGQGFSVATVKTIGFEADLCLSDTEHPVTPQPGNIVSGTVYLVATVDGVGVDRTRPPS
jgi:hypothetical protein